MLIKQPPSSSSPHPVVKPQVHTRLNHHTYNGALHLPESTHVRVIPHDPKVIATNPTITSDAVTKIAADYRKRSKTKPDRRRYVITLFYAHNRACELSRSADDVLVLREALAKGWFAVYSAAAASCVVRAGEGGGNGSSSSSSRDATEQGGDGGSGGGGGGNGSGNINNETGCSAIEGDVPAAAQQTPPCARTCSCPCPCAVWGSDVRSAMEVNRMLTEALKKVGKGDRMARVAVEWFLRRRIGDCGVGDVVVPSLPSVA
jgi:hypothetical protein